MRTKVIFETAGEFFDACRKSAPDEFREVILPKTVQVVFDNDGIRLQGQGSEEFEISADVTQPDMIMFAFDLANTSVYIT